MALNTLKIRKNLPILLGLLVGLVCFTFGILGFDLSNLPGNFGDTRFNIYILEHAHQYFFLNNVPTENYWDAPIFYPQESTISFSDNLLGVFFLYSIFRFLGADIYTSFQLWMILITILNYLSAYYFFKFLLKNRYSAVLGAFVFTFSIALMGQYAHPQTFPRFCIPIAFLFAIKFFKDHKVKNLFLLTFFVVYQFYCVIYLGFMLAVPLILFTLLIFLFKGKSILKQLSVSRFLGYFGCLIVNFLLLLPLLMPYMNSPIQRKNGEEIIYRTYDEVFYTIPKLKSYFFTNGETFFWGFLNNTAKDLKHWWDQQLFPGALCMIALLIILVYTLKKIRKKHNISQIYFLIGTTAVLTFLLYLRTDTFSLYEYVFELPGFSALRALYRIINIELLFFGLFVGLAFKLVFDKTKYQMWFFALTFVLLALDNYSFKGSYSTFSKVEARARLEGLREELINEEKGSLFSFEPAIRQDNKRHYHIDAMLIAQELGLKTINGYSGTVPFGYYSFAANLNEKSRLRWLKKKNFNGNYTVINGVYDPELKRIIKKIKESKEWLKQIKNKATKKKIPLEQAIVKNAMWLVEEKEKKRERE